MPGARTILFVLLGSIGALFAVAWFRAMSRAAAAGRPPLIPAGKSVVPGGAGDRPTLWEIFVGFFTDFFDTLGIGSFAPTTAAYRWRRTVDDRLIPGTLNVGHTLPTIVQAFIFIQSVKVEMQTLVSMIAAAVAGAWLGAGVVARWPRKKIQIGMGLALLGVGSVIVVRQIANPEGGNNIGLHGARLAVGVACNFGLGALMTIGIGLYAPCLVLVWLLGMDPTTGFPIMMGSCAFLMPIASWRFIKEGCYSPRAALGLTLGGIPAVLIAGLIVKSLKLYWVQWLVVVVVLYTSISMLLAARKESARTPTC